VPNAESPAERQAATYYGEGKIDTTPAGIARDSVIIASADRGVSLAIDAGTEVFDSNHAPLAHATAQAVAAGSVPSVPDGTGIRFTGMAYDLGPAGATFNPPATIRFTISGDKWDPAALYAIRTYSAVTGSWEDIPTTVDPGTRIVSGRVSHLCLFGLFAVPVAASATTPPITGAPVATLEVRPQPLPRTPMTTFTGMLEWAYAMATANLTVSFTILVGGFASLYTFTRRAWLSLYRSWVILYLASLTGLLWASFLYASAGPFWEAFFILVTVAGLNLIVHVFRFDRIDLSSRAVRGYVEIGRR
jgi:hypothetical protein